MHELSIAMSILELAAEQAELQGDVQVVSVHVRVGALSGVVKEALESAFELARAGSSLAETRLEVLEVPVRIFCRSCQREQTPFSCHELCCPECGSFSSEVRAGRELELCALEVVE